MMEKEKKGNDNCHNNNDGDVVNDVSARYHPMPWKGLISLISTKVLQGWHYCDAHLTCEKKVSHENVRLSAYSDAVKGKAHLLSSS